MDIVITIFTVVLWVLLALLGLVLFVVNMPYLARVDATWDENQLHGHAYVGWPLRLLCLLVRGSFEQQRLGLYLFGLRIKTWSFEDLKKKGKDGTAAGAKKKKEKSKKKKRPQSAAERLYMMRMPHKEHGLRQVARWFCLRASLQGRFGFDDPYTTAQVAMALSLIQMALPSVGRDVTLDYLDTVFEGRLKLSMMVWLPRILLGAAIFFLSRKGRAMVRYYFARPKPAQATQTTA